MMMNTGNENGKDSGSGNEKAESTEKAEVTNNNKKSENSGNFKNTRNSKKFGYAILAWTAATVTGVALMVLSKAGIAESSQSGGVLIGVGAALAVLGIGNLVGKYVTKAVETPETIKVSQREENDERNVRIREKAGWNASHITLYVLSFLAVASALMDLDLYITISLALLILMDFLLIVGSIVYYEKRM
ncbi:drug/metabolite transporter (DMT)-like permease [Methanomicrobium sp. W14]|uniref:hypothetical protein n=1 Tax=Methanomicrobium sp. W14 TaxID=2817839 RepID=UPI001FD87477|nr:hypothetical protein [Methanomicrobium sp. W14]MBP2134240.1 drug/metabolite transporter (DMT)-like permease [Methanomicrobium sp. W14]